MIDEFEKETQETNGEEAPETSEADKPEKSKDLQSALAQKEHFREKAEKAESKVKELETKLGAGVVKPTEDPMVIVRLAKALEGYDEAEADFILRNAKDSSPKEIIAASQDDWVKTAINAKREKVEKDKKVPSPSSPSAIFGDKSFDDVKGMSREEHKKWAEEQAQKSQSGGEGI